MNSKVATTFLEGFVLPLLAIVFVWLIATITKEFPWYRIAARMLLSGSAIYLAYMISNLITELKKNSRTA